MVSQWRKRFFHERLPDLEEPSQPGALDPGGCSRRLGSLTERARSTVIWRIRHALRRIEPLHEPLARHLANSIRTGTFCMYWPERKTEWRLGD